jgi:hypothetical protein
MKKFFLFAVALVAMSMVSCDKDDEERFSSSSFQPELKQDTINVPPAIVAECDTLMDNQGAQKYQDDSQ